MCITVFAWNAERRTRLSKVRACAFAVHSNMSLDCLARLGTLHKPRHLLAWVPASRKTSKGLTTGSWAMCLQARTFTLELRRLWAGCAGGGKGRIQSCFSWASSSDLWKLPAERVQLHGRIMSHSLRSPCQRGNLSQSGRSGCAAWADPDPLPWVVGGPPLYKMPARCCEYSLVLLLFRIQWAGLGRRWPPDPIKVGCLLDSDLPHVCFPAWTGTGEALTRNALIRCGLARRSANLLFHRIRGPSGLARSWLADPTKN